MLRDIHAENELALADAGYGRWHAEQGDMAQAREYLNYALEIFERLGTLGEPDKVRQALAALSVELVGLGIDRNSMDSKRLGV